MSVNAYANLGNLGGFSPYVGGGIGLAHVEYSGTNSDITCTVDPGESCHLGAHSGATANPETFTDNQTFAGGTSVNLTYALMLGLDYKIDENWTVDMNYRYTHISSDEVYSSGADSVHFDGADIHEVRAGVRYEVW
jgi:opacity protein-like surface antigen